MTLCHILPKRRGWVNIQKKQLKLALILKACWQQDSFDSPLPSVPIGHSSWYMISTQSWWSANNDVFMCRCLQENTANKFVLTSTAVPSMSCLPYSDGLQDGRFVAIQLLFWGGVTSRICLKENSEFKTC